MSVKYDLPNIYVSELQQYQALFILGDLRTSSGSGSWLSVSSGLTYNYTTGQNDLFAQLQTFLEPYLITAGNFNSKVDAFQFSNLEGLLVGEINDLQADVKTGDYNYFVTTNVGNDYSITTGSNYLAYVDGMTFKIKFNASSTGDVTLNVDGIGATCVKTLNTDNLSKASINNVYTIVYNGANFITQGVEGFADAGIQVFTSSGTFTAPFTGKYKVTVTGGGGSSARDDFSTSAVTGGGGGGTAIKVVSLNKGEVIPITVGVGGVQLQTVGTSFDLGVAGGTSSFGAHCSATGGAGGSRESSSGTNLLSGDGGNGVGGDVNIKGGHSGWSGKDDDKSIGGSSFWGGFSRFDPKAYGTGAHSTRAKHASGDGMSGIVVVEWMEG